MPTVILESGAKGRPGSAVRVIAFGRLWPSVAVCGGCRGCRACRGLRFRVGGVTKIEDRRPKTAIPRGRGRKSERSGAAKRQFRVGGVTKTGDPAPQNGHSAWEGSQKWEIRRPKTAIPRGRGHKIYILATSRSSASGGCYL